jgi:very-short-patch-repair endonuclease
MKKPKPVGLTRGLRRRQTDAEEKLWLILRNRKLGGVKFRRQQSIGDYVVDFVCFQRKLIIEVDGSQHVEISNLEKDATRGKYLESRGYKVLRFWNADVLGNIEGVFIKIQEKLSTMELLSHD